MSGSIEVTVQAFGVLQQACGSAIQPLQVCGPPRVDNALRALARRYPQAEPHLARSACAIGDRLVSRQAVLEPGSTLVLIPPISGG